MSSRVTDKESYDVVVLGSGAAGLTAALAAAGDGRSVAVYEKADKLGGTTALSSGAAWLPTNPIAAMAGVEDTTSAALQYLSRLAVDTAPPELLASFVNSSKSTVSWLNEHTPLTLRLVPRFPDYHPEFPGGLPGGGRTLEPELFSFERLGEWGRHVVGYPRRIRYTETAHGGDDELTEAEATRRSEHALEGLGRAMTGALLRGCLDADVRVFRNPPALQLLVDQGRIVGVRIQMDGAEKSVWARRGVVIATGGYEWNESLVRNFVRGPIAHPPGVRSNTGDGLLMAMRVGAMIGNMPYASWMPIALAPAPTDSTTTTSTLVLRERTVPGTIMVNDRGRRFTNEASDYNSLGGAFHQFDPGAYGYANEPCWLIFDAECVRKYEPFGSGLRLRDDWYTTADSLEQLAQKTGLPYRELRQTIDRWNAIVKSGEDTDFGRGRSLWDGWCGDRKLYATPSATLGTISAPLFAVRIYASTLGTRGGPRTDKNGRVLGVDGTPMSGLYAAGNAMAAPTGMGYGGAGGTLGPALVFGYLAGRDAAQQPSLGGECDGA